MRDIDKEQPTIKQYLLGHLDEEERQRFEEQFVTDPEFREVALIVEGELLDDYLAGLLPPGERERFVSHYLSAPRQIQELEFAKALREYAIQGEATVLALDAEAPPTKTHHKVINLLLGRRGLPALAGVALLLIALAISWNLVGRQLLGDQHADLNAEVALLNRQSRKGESPLTVTLTHVRSRAAQQGQKVSIPSGMNIAELQLNIPSQQYQSYQATLLVNDGPEVFTVGGLQAEDTDGGRVIRLRIPARLLAPQDYILSLRGLTAGGQFDDVAEYFFRVVR
jgi:hypothetical protein